MDVVVDDLDIPNERQAWQQVADDLKKPVYLRTELEASRILTLLTRLKYFQRLSFQERFSVTKVVAFRMALAGEVLLTARGNPRLAQDDGDTGGTRGDGGAAVTNTAAGMMPMLASVPSSGPSQGRRGTTMFTRFAEGGSRESFGAQDRPGHVYVIVFGTVGLRIPTVNGRVQSVLGKGDAVGNPLVEEALPPGSEYVALESVELLQFTIDQFHEHLAAVDEAELRSRIQFFKGLVVPVLQPWSDSEYEALARSVYPMRLQSKELVVKEGTVGDAMYFLLSGKLKVVREVDFSSASHAANSGLTTITTNPNSNSGLVSTGAGASTTYTPLVKLLELAVLQEGEFFGELALIRYRVDDNRRTTILKILSTSVSEAGNSTSTANRGAGGRTRRSIVPNTTGNPILDALQFDHGGTNNGGDADGGDDDDGDDVHVKEVDPLRPPLNRQATVYAHTPAVVLVLPRLCFIDLFRGPSLVRLREYAKGYPSQQDIKNHFQRQQRWETFKAEVVAQVRGSDRHAGRAGGSSSSGVGGGGGTGLSPRLPRGSPRRGNAPSHSPRKR